MKYNRPAVFLCFRLVCLLVLFCPGQVVSATCPAFPALIDNGAYAVASSDGTMIGCNVDTPYIPASILKIATALVALHTLGPEYRFRTELYLDAADNLYIRGFGDPLLVSEEIALIARDLKGGGLDRVRGIYIDDQAFSLAGGVPGRGSSDNPYDAPIGPTAVNFNTVPLRVDDDHAVRSSEPQTPTLPLMRELGAGRGPGTYRINLDPGNGLSGQRMVRYTAELFRALLQQAGIRVGESYGHGRVPAGSRRILVYFNSHSLDQVCRSMLEFSSNYMANLVYLAVGAGKYGYPATWNKARQAVDRERVRLLGAHPASCIRQVDGAGLSRENRVTARGMLALLKAFWPYRHLLPLRRKVRVKSGTLQGVYTLAGFLQNGKPFVILLNQQKNTRTRILQRLCKRF